MTGDLEGDLHGTAWIEEVGVMWRVTGPIFLWHRCADATTKYCDPLQCAAQPVVVLELMVDKNKKINYSVYYDHSNIVLDGKSLWRPAPAGAGAAWFVDAGFAESHDGGHLGGGY
jgi:hypothetical protein